MLQKSSCARSHETSGKYMHEMDRHGGSPERHPAPRDTEHWASAACSLQTISEPDSTTVLPKACDPHAHAPAHGMGTAGAQLLIPFHIQIFPSCTPSCLPPPPMTALQPQILPCTALQRRFLSRRSSLRSAFCSRMTSTRTCVRAKTGTAPQLACHSQKALPHSCAGSCERCRGPAQGKRMRG